MDSYQVQLKLGSQILTASASDPTEALLSLKPEKLNAQATFTLTYKGKKATLQRPVLKTRRILSQYHHAYYFARNLISLLK